MIVLLLFGKELHYLITTLSQFPLKKYFILIATGGKHLTLLMISDSDPYEVMH